MATVNSVHSQQANSGLFNKGSKQHTWHNADPAITRAILRALRHFSFATYDGSILKSVGETVKDKVEEVVDYQVEDGNLTFFTVKQVGAGELQKQHFNSLMMVHLKTAVEQLTEHDLQYAR